MKSYIVRFILSIFVIVFWGVISNNSYADVSLANFKKDFDINSEYTVYLTNGDMISGKIIELLYDADETDPIAIKLSSIVGIIKIYEDEIQRIYCSKFLSAGTNRAFIMPTANPVGSKFSLASYELFALYSEVGILDLVSITGATTLIPKLVDYESENVSFVNAKISLPKLKFQDSSSVTFALGANAVFLGANDLYHIYGLATYNTQDASQVTAGLFYKIANQDLPMGFSFFGKNMLIDYPDNTFGISANTEVNFSNRKDLFFIGEFWNSDLSKPTNSIIILGLRLKGRNFSSDFGLLLSTQPFLAPVINFMWTFN